MTHDDFLMLELNELCDTDEHTATYQHRELFVLV